MSRLSDLIAELCPDGVSSHRIDEICDITRGKVMSKAYIRENAGNYPVYSSQTENEGELGRINTYDFEGEYLTWTTDGANAGSVFYRNGKFSVTNVCGLLKTKSDGLLTKYLYYTLALEAPEYVNAGMGNPKLMSNVMARVKVPVPPIKVQQEIVRILDEFTVLMSDLSKELSAELTARKKQYDYYLNKFYEELPESTYVPISSLGTLTRGKRFVHKDAVEEGVPCIHYGELYTYYGVHTEKARSHIREELRPKMRYAKKGDVIIVGAGENNIDIGVGVAWEGDEEVAVHDACYTLNHKQNPRYISYFLRTDYYHRQIKKYVSEGKICAISADGIGKALIPIPSIEKQEEIVRMLDSFSLLVSDFSNEIPAEIKARKAQYEYYRDRLLGF